MAAKAVVVFTAKTVEQLLALGGSASWKLNRSRVLESEFLVCARNRHTNWGQPSSEAHCSGFLVGRISGVVPATPEKDRWLIQIREYAHIAVPEIWKGWRYPVRYMTLEELGGIYPSKLVFKPMPEVDEKAVDLDAAASAEDGGDEDDNPGLTIAEARAGLAKTFGVAPEAIEITIRG
jgi:hypothetical protein